MQLLFHTLPNRIEAVYIWKTRLSKENKQDYHVNKYAKTHVNKYAKN